jgi:hypothetical protein
MLLFLYHKINKTILMSKIVQKFWVSFGGVFDECMRKPKKHIKLIELLKPENKANLGPPGFPWFGVGLLRFGGKVAFGV